MHASFHRLLNQLANCLTLVLQANPANTHRALGESHLLRRFEFVFLGTLIAGFWSLMSGSVVAMIFGFLALILASINIFGGFMVTSRMLAMYKKKDK